MVLHLRPSAVLVTLLVAIAFLAVAGRWAGDVRQLAPASVFRREELQLFDLSCENNVPTWFSSVQLFVSGALAFLLGGCATRHRRHWWLLAATLVGVSLVEDASLFEHALAWLSHFGGSVPFGLWRVAALAIAAVAAIVFAPLVGTLHPRHAALVLVATGLFTIGHFGFAALGGWIGQHHGTHVPAFVWARVAEETSKLLGEALGLVALLAESRRRGVAWRFA